MTATTALVTGASRGIGRAIAEALAGAGHALALCARDPDRLEQVAVALRDAGAPVVIAVPADLRDPATPAAVLDAVIDRLGPLEILVNNAGTAPTARFDKTSDGQIDEALDLHLKAPFRLIRGALPAMLERGRGSIIQVASTAALRGFAYTSAYTAAKHAMVGMTRALAEELRATPIRTWAVCPGFVDTDITRAAADAIARRGGGTPDDALAAMAALNRIGRMHAPSEVADAVLRLCRERPDGCVLDLDADPPEFV